jgi:hypothetical protein
MHQPQIRRPMRNVEVGGENPTHHPKFFSLRKIYEFLQFTCSLFQFPANSLAGEAGFELWSGETLRSGGIDEVEETQLAV